ncbi:MAG: aminotransferase class III-fold pyridoxal phosphate-dependent enzyme [Chloroflexi bacterium]|nr:aminotransferase class III-fold pyridoxal phosphate-dependent enzyme [Chloroflexota bacterium]
MTSDTNAGSACSYARSTEWFGRARRSLAGGVSSNFRMGGQPVPLFFERAAGAHLWDLDGNVYLDYVLGMGPVILGHAPARVIDAVSRCLANGQVFAGQHPAEVRLAEQFQQLVPCAELVRFGVSGSEMDQAAVRAARAVTGRVRVVKFEGHYHGWLDTLLVSPAGSPLEALGPVEAPLAYLPSAGQSIAATEEVTPLPWNDLTVLETYLAKHADETAAVLMEPILCNTSVVTPLPGYLAGVRELCDRYGVVLIFDEVITGFRVGLGGAQKRLGITPDLAVFAKAVAGGFTIAVLAGKRRYMAPFADGSALHGGTFNSNLVSTVAALATLEALAEAGDAGYLAMETRGERLMADLREVGAPAGLRVQGLGMAFNTAFGGPDTIENYRDYALTDADRQKRFVTELQHRGVRVTSRGTWFLSLAHTDADIDLTLEAARGALDALA